jgi:hypothetical protein
VRPLPSTLVEAVPDVLHWKRMATYGQRLWGIPLGSNFLVSIERPNDSESKNSSDESTKSAAPSETLKSGDWIVDRFLQKAAEANPSPNDSSFLFKPTGAKSRLNEAWLTQAAIDFVNENADESSTAQFFDSAETVWEATRHGAFKRSLGWPSASSVENKAKSGSTNAPQNLIEQDCLINAPKTWVDAGRTLIVVVAQANRQSASSERFIKWLSDDEQRQALSVVTSRIKPLPDNQRKVSDRPDRDTYHRLISSAMNERNVAVELQFAGAEKYRQALATALTKIIRKESDAQEALLSCHAQWEATTNQLGRENQQRLLYRSLEIAKWEQ